MSGFVSLVGAGPGAADLITLRAVNRLRACDLVLVDALVADEVLALAPPTAKRFYVGKRAGRHSIEQDEINRLMIRAAKRGERVVRLKCGDPFVLGRGGEEALALEAAGVAYEVVPGLSSAIAAPALAGIPVTHRGLATSFVVLSGHAPDAYGPIVDSLAPASATLVVLMGIASRADLARRLVARGWDATTPAAIVYGASHDGSTRILTTLADLARSPTGHGSDCPGTGHKDFTTLRNQVRLNSELGLPGVLVIGAVVGLADQIANSYAGTGVASTAATGITS